MKTINKTHYNIVAARINKVLKGYAAGTDMKPRVEVLERGTDGLIILMNDEAYEIAERPGTIQDLFYTGTVFVVGDDDLYIEPYDSKMAFKVVA